MNPSSSFAKVFGLKCEFGGYRQYYLGSCFWIAEQIQLAPILSARSRIPFSPQCPAFPDCNI
jgi:hypothetical protein